MTLAQLNARIVGSLEGSLGLAEARATARLLLEDDLGVTPVKLALNGDRVLEPETEARFDRYISAIRNGMPPQYALGKARFMGMTLHVSPATLIPRPETAELVDIIVDRHASQPDLRVADLGTGSGCIAIALARALPFSQVTAVDASADALAVARHNASDLKAKVSFLEADILAGLPLPSEKYDIIVSNPPYVAMGERSEMDRRVKDYEPSSALFVPDDDPLRFYAAIATWAGKALKSDGSMYFEINPLFASRLAEMFQSKGFDCSLQLDSFGKTRFAVCRFAGM